MNKDDKLQKLKSAIDCVPLEKFKLLCQKQRDFLEEDKDIFSLIVTAIYDDELEIIKFLIEKFKFNPNYSLDNGNTLLHHACAAAMTSLKTIEYLVSICDKSLINSQNTKGYPPIFNAAMTNNIEVVEYLFNINANLNLIDANGDLMFSVLIRKYQKEAVNGFIYGDGITPEIIYYLLEHGAKSELIPILDTISSPEIERYKQEFFYKDFEGLTYSSDSEIPENLHGFNNIFFAQIRNALKNKTALLIDYVDRNGNLTNRKITPETIYFEQKNWYMSSYCHLRNEDRTFKLENIKNAVDTLEKIEKVVHTKSIIKEIPLDWEKSFDKIEAKIFPQEGVWELKELFFINDEKIYFDYPFDYEVMAESLQILFNHDLKKEYTFSLPIFMGCACGFCEGYDAGFIEFRQRGEKIYITTAHIWGGIFENQAFISIFQWAQLVESALEQQLKFLKYRKKSEKRDSDDEELIINSRRDITLDYFYKEVAMIQYIKELYPNYFLHPDIDLCPEGVIKELPPYMRKGVPVDHMSIRHFL